MKMQIGAYLARRLAESGVRHVFGVPGDFNLPLLEQIEANSLLEFTGNCNELNAAYAADGCARTAGISALVTTYGVGDLSAINGIAGAYAENVPVVHITGAPPLHAMNSRALLHHTLADGAFGNVNRCMAEFTVARARITPANALFEIDRVLNVCWLERRPVHLQIPSDVTHLMIDTPKEALVLPEFRSDPEQLEYARSKIVDLLRNATSTALLIDAEAGRFGVADLVFRLAEKWGIPYAVLGPAKAIMPETSSLFAGTYVGAASSPATRALVEDADCLVGIGLRFTDTSSGLFSHHIDTERLIHLRRHDLDIGREPVPGVALREILQGILDEFTPSGRRRSHANASEVVPTDKHPDATDEHLTQAALWARIQCFLKPGDIVIGEAGTSHSGLSEIQFPSGADYIAQPIWGSIGYSLPALLGSMLAAPSRRHLLFIGDGSFQLTAQELSTILRCDLRPIIFLINNDGYTIERLILGKNSRYNDVNAWRYAELPYVLDQYNRSISHVVNTCGELDDVLNHLSSIDKLLFIEVRLARMDAPETLKSFSASFAEFDYGRRGPRDQ
jgi:indolepyruvate decarboxylase